MSNSTSTNDTHDLTDGERALARATYAAPYDELSEAKQERFRSILADLPEPLRAGLDGNVITKARMAEGMEEVFTKMVADDDLPDAWKDGAAVFAKALHKKFGLDAVADLEDTT